MSEKNVNMEQGSTFASAPEFDNWLSENYNKSKGIWVHFYKKSSGIVSITEADLIDTLLCYGWITGPAKRGSDQYVLWWVCPRKDNSSWSKTNIKHAERLITEKRVKPSCMAEIQKAKVNGQWMNG